MSIFNPNIVEASLRDVATCLSDNQKVDLLLYAMKTLKYDGRSRIVFDNAIQSCLLIPTLSPENTAKARIIRARARLNAGSVFGAQEGIPETTIVVAIMTHYMQIDLQAALAADPDNPEAQALLHQRSVNVEKLLAPEPLNLPRSRFSPEVWREITCFLPRKDLKTLLLVPNPVSHVASQLLFRQLDLHFSGLSPEYLEEENEWSLDKDRHSQRSADILARIITDNSFASVIRTLRVFSFKLDGDAGFHVGILANALPKLINLQNVHITASVEGALSIIRILEFTRPQIHGLSLQILDSALDLSGLNFTHLAHFSYNTQFSSSASSSNPSPSTAAVAPQSTTLFVAQNNVSLRRLSIQTPSSGFPPTESLALRNLTHLAFTGCIPASVPNLLPDILIHGRQIESLCLTVLVDCVLSQHFRSMSSNLPFLRHFSFSIGGGVSRRLNDRDLFPSIAEFLRGRKELRSLTLTAPCTPLTSSNTNAEIQRLTGFDSGVWGVLPTLTELTALTISWPKDLAPGLGGWLIPRTVKALVLDGIGASLSAQRDAVAFFNQLRPGIPASLVYVGLMDSPLRSPAQIIEQGFPMVKLLRLENTYWTVNSNLGSQKDRGNRSPTLRYPSAPGTSSQSMIASGAPAAPPGTLYPATSSTSAPSSSSTTRTILPSRTLSHSHTPGYSHTSTTYHPSPSSTPTSAPSGARPILPSVARPTSDNRIPQLQPTPITATTRQNSSVASAAVVRHSSPSTSVELEKWPRRRVVFHSREWLEWLGCPDVVGYECGDFGF
ncbi:hypothetical protein E1B28_002353 [Marasmius oreades]|uniref:Uncharacterized protein n=1 Tax=Marasmius oreades TaxID=181124 RepID=A0A9P7RNX8_9AGAR|nr:uncharacterized protein E1B28_002353 [Marasmius oreades]KAG7086398.1 hypothetical protein E1B28_002353 [Marasmius oreades]